MTNGKQPEGNKGTFGTEWAHGHADRVGGIFTSKWPSGKPIRSAGSGADTAKGTYSYGKPKVTDDFEYNLRKITDEVAATVARKQNDYGPNNIRKSPFGPMIGLTVRLYDKIARLANLSQGKEPKNESLRDTFIDIAGYGIIGLMVLDSTFPDDK